MKEGCPIVFETGEPCGKAGQTQEGHDRFECERCKGCYIHHHFVVGNYNGDEWHNHLGAIRHLKLRGTNDPLIDTKDGYDSEGLEIRISQFPESISEKAAKLLEALVAMSKTFGDLIKLGARRDYPLAYAKCQLALKQYQ